MNALIVATVGGFIDFEKKDIALLRSLGYRVTVACNTKGSEQYLCDIDAEIDAEIVHICFDRSPISSENIKAYCELKKLIRQGQYDIIHCHTPVAGVLTRIASRSVKKSCVIYTAHGFHFYKGAPVKNWLLYYPAEWLCAWFTDMLITINKEDYAFAKRKLHVKDIRYVPGVGVDIEKMRHPTKEKSDVRASLGLSDGDKMLFSVGEINENKNHSLIIKAMKEIGNPKLHYFIAGNGSRKNNLMEIAREYGLEKQVHLLGYRMDVADLYHSADVYCHPSFREGLSVALMEAFSAGVNVVCSDIRGNRDLAEDCKNVVLFDPSDIQDAANAIRKQLSHIPQKDNGIQKYSLDEVQKRMREIYTKQ